MDELLNDITGGATPASFEPSIDYVVTKIPRFAFEKFPASNDRLTTQMKSVGEAMAIGRTFQESLQKALRGLETGRDGFDPVLRPSILMSAKPNLNVNCVKRVPNVCWYVADAFRGGMSGEEIHQLTSIDPWFLRRLKT